MSSGRHQIIYCTFIFSFGIGRGFVNDPLLILNFHFVFPIICLVRRPRVGFPDPRLLQLTHYPKERRIRVPLPVRSGFHRSLVLLGRDGGGNFGLQWQFLDIGQPNFIRDVCELSVGV